MVDRLELAGTLSSVDDAALRRYAKLHADTEDIDKEHTELRAVKNLLMKEVRRLQDSDLVEAIGKIAEFMKLSAKHRQEKRQGAMALRMWLVEFGMTPAARTRVQRQKPSPAKSKVTQFREAKSSSA